MRFANPAEEVGFVSDLIELAATYRRWRQQPQSSREVQRQQLTRLAELCVSDDVELEYLRYLIGRLDTQAETSIWAELRRTPGWPENRMPAEYLASEPDAALIGPAAARAVDALRGGDYPDTDLYAAIAGLIDVFEWVTGDKAQTGRFTSETRICQLAYAFFAIAEPALAKRKIFNALEAELRGRRKVS